MQTVSHMVAQHPSGGGPSDEGTRCILSGLKISRLERMTDSKRKTDGRINVLLAP
uniref:Uncharacterized protein n=1 Tax=Arundo donax TaxID=35708 RepID=A0A0A9ANW9_ARUDO